MPRKDFDSYWFKFYPDKYLGGTAGFSMEMHGAYLILLLHQWESGSIKEEAALSIIGDLWHSIKHKFVETESGYVNVRMDEERNHKQKISQKRALAVMSRYKAMKNKKVKAGYNCTTNVVQPVSVSVSNSISDSSSLNSWKEDINIYYSLVDKAFEDIVTNEDEMNKLQRYNPNLNIKLSLEKAMYVFWKTEAGWKNKKKSRAKEIDMKSTLIKSLDINRVFKENPQQRFGRQEVSREELKEQFNRIKLS